mgnify:CR=1 FL=1|tara:strand:- start:1504 stop:1737 length:234 start_codon:yes stop_codon:yes gene_type:complete
MRHALLADAEFVREGFLFHPAQFANAGDLSTDVIGFGCGHSLKNKNSFVSLSGSGTGKIPALMGRLPAVRVGYAGGA